MKKKSKKKTSSKPETLIEPLPSGFMASYGEYVGVGESRRQALQRMWEKMPKELAGHQ